MVDRHEQFPRLRNRQREDLSGKKVNHLFVLKPGPDYVNPSGSRFTQWICKCDCGNECIKRTTALKSGKAISCGCVRSSSMKDKNVSDLTGQVFGYWTVIGRDPVMYKDRIVHWFCKCACGTVKSVSGASLRKGVSTSCGCSKGKKVGVK